MCGAADAVVNIPAHNHEYACSAGYTGKHYLIENTVAESEGDSFPAPFDREQQNVNLRFVGRFDRQKGLDLAVNAFNLASLRRPDLRLQIVGAPVLGDGKQANLAISGCNITCHGW